MELNISEKSYILPAAVVGETTTYKIVVHPDTEDCIIETKKPLNNGKGEYSQFELCLENKKGELKSARFLMSQQLKPLVMQWGQNTADWINQFVDVIGEEDGQYFKLCLTAAGIPQWAHEEVKESI